MRVSVGRDRKPCKMAEPIEILFFGRGADSYMRKRNRVLDGDAIYRIRLNDLCSAAMGLLVPIVQRLDFSLYTFCCRRLKSQR